MAITQSREGALLLNEEQRAILRALIKGRAMTDAGQDINLGYNATVMQLNRARSRNNINTNYELTARFAVEESEK